MDEAVRWYNLACSIAVALAGIPQLHGFLTRGGKEQLHWQSTILFNVTAGWGTLESIRGHYPGGVRVYLLAAALTWLLATVLYMPALRWRAKHPQPKE